MTISSMKCYDVFSHSEITLDCSELWEEESTGLLWVWYNYVMLEYLQHQQHDNFWLWMWTMEQADRIWTSQSFFLPSSMSFNFISSWGSAHLAAFLGLDWQSCHSNVKSCRAFFFIPPANIFSLSVAFLHYSRFLLPPIPLILFSSSAASATNQMEGDSLQLWFCPPDSILQKSLSPHTHIHVHSLTQERTGRFGTNPRLSFLLRNIFSVEFCRTAYIRYTQSDMSNYMKKFFVIGQVIKPVFFLFRKESSMRPCRRKNVWTLSWLTTTWSHPSMIRWDVFCARLSLHSHHHFLFLFIN